MGCAWVHHAHRLFMVHRRFVTANIPYGFRVRNMKTLRTLPLDRHVLIVIAFVSPIGYNRLIQSQGGISWPVPPQHSTCQHSR